MAKIVDNTNKVLSEVEALKREKLELSCVIVERGAKIHCPVRTGTLRRSITHEVEGNVGRIGTNVRYGKWVELGTKPHTIVPKTAKALYWDGASHPVKVVRHPGTTAQPFLRPALMEAWPEIKALWSQK